MRYVAGILVVLLALCLLKEAWEVWPIDDAQVRAITTLSTPEAYRLVKSSWFWRRSVLHLDGLTTLSDEAAEALAQHKGHLYLDGLTTLSDEAAKALAQYEGWLHLDGLRKLSDEAAVALRANPDIDLPNRFSR